MRVFFGTVLAAALVAAAAQAQTAVPVDRVRAEAARLQPKVVAWRRDLHQNPELANREKRTAKVVADHLKKLGLEVRTGVAHTGVVGVLKGGKPGPVVAIRADMDALPVEEKTGLPFASKAKGEFDGKPVSVAHACGHDSHVAMLMAAAEILAGMKADIPGTIVFLFQPAEEGPPPAEGGGAKMMIEQGALSNPAPSAIFGLHSLPGESGTIFYRSNGLMAAADQIHIKLKGKQTHGAWPWQGIDVVSLGAGIVSELNTVAARQNDARIPLVLTIATVNAGVRYNIIPDELTMTGTLRTFEPGQRTDMKARIEKVVAAMASTYGATSEVKFIESGPVTWNDAGLAQGAFAALEQAAGPGRVNRDALPTTVSEDFSYYQQKIPGLFYFLGTSKPGLDPKTAPPNHSPMFDIDEAAMEVGVRAHVLTALAYLNGEIAPKP